MPSLMDLFPEILEEIVLKLESVEDVISLGSSCTSLARTVGQERLWRVILAKTDLVEYVEYDDEYDGHVREDRVRAISSFLSSLPNSAAMLSLLHETIYERYPATGQGQEEEEYTIMVHLPSSPQLHSVSSLRLELLAVTGREEARHIIHKVKVLWIPSSLLLPLANLKREQITELDVEDIFCTSEEEGTALVSSILLNEIHSMQTRRYGPQYRPSTL